MALITINDNNYTQFIDPTVNGEVKKCGTTPRDYMRCPVGYLPCAKPFDLPLIPEGDWQAWIDKKDAEKSWLEDIRNIGMYGQRIPSRDQGNRGYCWFHSGTSANLLKRADEGLPYADLSAYMGACIIKNYRDEGGWGSEGVEFMAENGVATSKTWPQQGTSRSYDTPAMREEAKLYRIQEWMDLEPRNKAQLVTCLLLNIPVVVDMNWWSHSICAVRVVKLNPFTIRIWNSWGDSWSQAGMGDLEGSRAIPDGQIAPRVIRASA